jgi:thiamine-phosphate pyrophosphorylase
MPIKMDYKNSILRIIDANINRAKEGFRVCEDIMRLVINDKDCTLKLKKIRHSVTNIIKKSRVDQFDIVKNRKSKTDIGRKIILKNTKNKIIDIFIANAQRAKESLRVLEELFSIYDEVSSRKFQNLRFTFYITEKDCYKKLK